MDNNVTCHLRIVGTEQAGIHPQVGCYLVLFKQVDEGRVFHSVLQPGERPPKPGFLGQLFNHDSTFVSMPITANPSLRHEFTSPLEHVTPGHSFEAEYKLGFAVEAPEKVAIRWVEDPVRKVEEEARRVIDSKLRVIEWERLRLHILKDGATQLCEDIVRNALEDLRPFAQNYGIDLHLIRLILRLSRTDAKPDADTVELERQKIAVQIETDKQWAEMTAKQKLKILEANHAAELGNLRRPEEVRDAIVAGAKVAIDNSAQSVHRVVDLVQAARDLTSLIGGPRGNGPALASNDAIASLNSGSSGPERKAVSDIMEIAAIVENLSGDMGRRRELFSALVHLIAEAYRGKSSDPERSEKYQQYQKQAEALVASDWGGSLGAPQYKALNRFKDFSTLQERFE